MFLPPIVQPTRITSHSKTLIDNTFSNCISQDVVSENLTATISDHLPQFPTEKTIYLKVSGQNSIMKNSF